MPFRKNRILLITLIFSIIFTKSYSQNNPIEYTVELNSNISTANTLPFWQNANKFGAVPNNNHLSTYISLFSDFKNSKSNFDFSYKASFTGLKETKNNILINELYTSARYKNIQLDLGVKHPEILWDGLSSSNGNVAISGNARSFPGYNISLIKYVKLPFAKKWLSVKGNYSDYLMNDKRVVTNTRLHSKSLFFKSKLSSKLDLITGLNHYAQWGGISSIQGKQPYAFKDYLKMAVVPGGVRLL